MQNEITEALLDEYFALGVAEGREGRDHDTPNGDAQRVRAALTQAAEPVAIPTGWHLVPEVPTEEQMNAGLYQSSHDATYADVCQSYMDMVRTPIDAPALFASPPVASPEPEDAANAIIKAIAWLKVDDKSRRFTDQHGKDEVIGFERAEQIWATIRPLLSARPTPPCDGRAEALEEAVEILEDAADILAERNYVNTAQRCQRAAIAIRALTQKDKADE